MPKDVIQYQIAAVAVQRKDKRKGRMMQEIMTDWQRVISRNYGMVPDEAIAKVLGTDAQTVQKCAKELGFLPHPYNPDWRKKGFVTIFRNNWDILPQEDIRTLLGVSEKEYATLLEDYDFLSVKLGKKPEVKRPQYAPLTEEGRRRTVRVSERVRSFPVPAAKPFDFYAKSPVAYYEPPAECDIADRFVSSYSARYDGALLDDDLSDYPDEYLKRLAATGVNGIWLQETLRNLSEFPFDPSFSPDYKKRLKNLRKLTERCAKFGLGVYLYLNEPRALPASFFEKYPDLRGLFAGTGYYCLCTSAPAVQKYLYEAVRSVAEAVPLLRAVMTITMSENATNCYSRGWKGPTEEEPGCPRCGKRRPEEVAAEVNNIFCRALRDGNGKTRLIANLWGWADFMGWSEESILHGVDLLDKEVDVLCVSEFSKHFERGGVKSQVIDYSISVVGPSEITVKMLERAKARGHRVWAKMQANNSWECSAVPYIPAFELMLEHISNLKKLGVSGLMMGWSLGGYPGGALPLCCMACGRGETDTARWYRKVYGEQGEIAREGVHVIGEAFREFPFSVDILYLAGHNSGCGNLWSLAPSGRSSTMVCYTFDDVETYTAPYGPEIYISQMRLLCEKWEKGLELLRSVQGNELFEELKRCAEGAYIHFRSAGLLAEFSLLKRDIPRNRERLIACAEEEMRLTRALYRLVCEDAKIGFEMTNHYYYTPALLIEKTLCLEEILEELKK